MSDFTKAQKALDFDKITEMLCDCARTEGAKALARSLVPMTDPVSVRRSLERVSAAKEMARIKGEPPFGGVKDVNELLDKAEKSAVLTPRELLDAADLLRTVRALCSYRKEEGNKGAEENPLDEDFGRLMPDQAFERRVYSVVIAEDMIADDASPELYDIRRKIRSANNRIREHLQKYVNGSLSGKFLQENIITMRNGRYVIPVKQEYRNEVKGLVHDISGSGATLFIEPMAVVEANNELRELQIKEQREIERILYELSADCAARAETLRLNYFNITALAFVFAKAELSRRLDASMPKISEKKFIRLAGARHPLIDKKSVVPISLELGGQYDSLIITGPNTGGKTVSLKTVGLFELMMQSGLHVPAESGTELYVFENILADIGDEQSIEQSLSTFSSHMVNVIDILSKTGPDSLVLFDELGAGTDPVEGAALAISLIESVRERGALCVATTHYAELKTYAIDTEGVMNAGCEFDIGTLKPTYRLIVGSPGKSNAFAISEKLGLPKSIVERAQALVDSDDRDFENVIAKLDEARRELEKEKAELDAEKEEYERFRQTSEGRIRSSLEQAEKEAEKVRAQAVRLIEGARVASDRTFAELEELKKKKDSEKFSEQLDEARREIRRRLKNTDTDVNTVPDRRPADYEFPRELKRGDEVLVCDIGKYGTLDADPSKDGRVSVKIGNVTIRTRLEDLMLKEDAEPFVPESRNKKKRTAYSGAGSPASRSFSPELDLRGQNGEDAWYMVDKYIDEANMSGIESVRLIHGKGTGALRRALWEFLKKDKRVKSYRIGMYGEGDSGVTVVELK